MDSIDQHRFTQEPHIENMMVLQFGVEWRKGHVDDANAWNYEPLEICGKTLTRMSECTTKRMPHMEMSAPVFLFSFLAFARKG